MKTASYSVATAVSLAMSIGSLAYAQHYTQVNLVANTSGVAPVTDPNLVNPWGISGTSGSPWWISGNGKGDSTLYNGAGAINPLVVTIPKCDYNCKVFPTGTPTGTIANSSPTDFLLAPGTPAAFLFSTMDGTISAWNPKVGVSPGRAPPSKLATIVIKTMDVSSYAGLTSASLNVNRCLYAANFNKGTVDVYDSAFHRVTKLSHLDQHGNEDNEKPLCLGRFRVEQMDEFLTVARRQLSEGLGGVNQQIALGLPPRLRQTVKTLLAVRCKMLDRQFDITSFWARPEKQRRAPVETDPPRDIRLRLIDADEGRECARMPAPGFFFPYRIERSPMP